MTMSLYYFHSVSIILGGHEGATKGVSSRPSLRVEHTTITSTPVASCTQALEAARAMENTPPPSAPVDVIALGSFLKTAKQTPRENREYPHRGP